jgi:hypothetical protein
MPPTKANSIIQEIKTAITFGTFHLLLRKETIGFNKIANKSASRSGTIICCPIEMATMRIVVQIRTRENLTREEGLLLVFISIKKRIERLIIIHSNNYTLMQKEKQKEKEAITLSLSVSLFK